MKIAGIEFCCSNDEQKNVEKACRMMDMAIGQGAGVLSGIERAKRALRGRLRQLCWWRGRR